VARGRRGDKAKAKARDREIKREREREREREITIYYKVRKDIKSHRVDVSPHPTNLCHQLQCTILFYLLRSGHLFNRLLAWYLVGHLILTMTIVQTCVYMERVGVSSFLNYVRLFHIFQPEIRS